MSDSDEVSKSDSELWKNKGELAASLLDFRRRAAETLDSLIANMIRNGGDAGIKSFQTVNGRPCIVVLTTGESSSTAMFKAFEKLNGD